MSAVNTVGFEACIADDLVRRYKLNRNIAAQIVRQSAIKAILTKYPQHVKHYPIESWADDVWRAHNHLSTDE